MVNWLTPSGDILCLLYFGKPISINNPSCTAPEPAKATKAVIASPKISKAKPAVMTGVK